MKLNASRGSQAYQPSWSFLRCAMRAAVWLAGAMLICLGAAQSEPTSAYPSRPIRIIVPIAPGGSVDVTARLIGDGLARVLGQSVVIENQSGGSGSIGTGVVARAAADGYTLVMGSSSTFAVNPTLMKHLPYDAIRDFAPVSFISFAPNVLVVPSSLPVKSVADLVALAKSKPGTLSFASSGVGGSPHLAGELFKREAGIDIIQVPYRGSGQSMTDLLAGRVDMSFSTGVAVEQQVRVGALRALAVTSAERLEVMPAVPTMAEAGYPNVLISAWNGLLAPAGTPKEIVAKLSAAVQGLKDDTKVMQQLKKDGSIFVGSTPDYFADFIKREIAKWGEVIRAANIQVE